MWLTTLDGMYSIVDKAVEGPDYLCVRSRDEDSLIRMRSRVVDFAKTNDNSVYVKTGVNDGLMWNGKFWTGKRLHGSGTDYEWRMAIPRELLMGYFNLAVIDLSYMNFKDRCARDWAEECEPDIAQRRVLTLTEIWSTWERLWPKRSSGHPSLGESEERPVLTMIRGGGEDDADTSGA